MVSSDTGSSTCEMCTARFAYVNNSFPSLLWKIFSVKLLLHLGQSRICLLKANVTTFQVCVSVAVRYRRMYGCWTSHVATGLVSNKCLLLVYLGMMMRYSARKIVWWFTNWHADSLMFCSFNCTYKLVQKFHTSASAVGSVLLIASSPYVEVRRV